MNAKRWLLLSPLTFLVLAGCAASAEDAGADIRDSGVLASVDAGSVDAGSVDAGSVETGTVSTDAGTVVTDAGTPEPDALAIQRCIGTNLQPVWNPTNASQGWPQETYTAIRARGFNCVRFVLFWDDYEPTAGVWRETAFASLKNGFDRAQAAGLKVVVDAVHLVGQPEGQSRVPTWARTKDGMEAVATKGLPFLKELARRFAKHPALGAWDPVNEPARYPVNHATVLADYTRIIDALREVDTVTPIVLEPTYGDALPSAVDFQSLKPKDRSKLIWSVHDYYVGGHGADYDARGVPLDGAGASDGTTGFVDTPQHRADLRLHVEATVNRVAAQEMKLWIGEFGIGARASGHDAYIEEKVAIYKSLGVGYAWWEYSDNGGAFSMVNASGGWLPWVAKLL